MRLSTFGILVSLLASSALPVSGAQEASTSVEQDEEKILEGVTTTGQRLDLDAPTTGKLVFRPVLYSFYSASSANIERVDLVFVPVELSDANEIIPFKESDPKRFTARMVIPTEVSRGTDQYSIDAFGMQDIDLPGGLYALSEVQYYVTPRIVGAHRPANAQGFGPVTRYVAQRAKVNFCMSEGALMFDVKTGETQYLGALGIANLPRSRTTNPRHRPLVALDRGRDKIISPFTEPGDIGIATIDSTTFEPVKTMCGRRSYRVPGWKHRDDIVKSSP